MNNLRAHIALLLLMLFCRVAVPEETLLALHQHEHTQDAVPTSDYEVSTKHQHCHIDEHFNSDFLNPNFTFELQLNPVPVCYVQPYSFAWKFTYPHNTYLRGPPVA